MRKALRIAACAWTLLACLLILGGRAEADEDSPASGSGSSPASVSASGDGGGDRTEDANSPAGAGARSGDGRSAYTYVRLVSGDVTVNSRWNGRVEARRNMPVSTGDEVISTDAARVEVGLADGNILHVGGGTRAEFESLSSQQGEDDDVSAIRLEDGSVVLAAIGRNEDRIPRIDTEDATVYLSAGARARVNFDARRGTVVIDRYGTVEVRTRSGSMKLRAGQYLMVRGDEEPTVDRGAFSRDRFDIWAADRMDALSDTRIASSRYVDPDYATDVESLDGYGDWSYSPTYRTEVWTPHVDIGWTPYSFGSWYYTPAGLTWWSNDPWGWYPFHYGNWFFEAALNRWCWTPASVYSPAWVYWAYTPNFVGWCPVGYYSGFGPWWDTYYRHSGFSRANLYVSLHGRFDPRHVDFRGWNFTGSGGVGATMGRADVIPGSRIGGRLGTSIAISSRPIVASARPGEGREAVRNFIREAPRAIDRTATGDSSRFAPILARERTLPPASADALRDSAVIAERGRLSGPAAADIAPRGTRTVERGRTAGPVAGAPAARAPENGSAPAASSPSSRETIIRGRADGGSPREAPAARTDERTNAPRAAEDWRTRGRNPGSAGTPPGTAAASPSSTSVAPENRGDRPRVDRDSSGTDWRAHRIARDNPSNPPTPQDADGSARFREVPPARRVIEGAVPGRGRDAAVRDSDGFRSRPQRPDPALRADPAPRPESVPRSEPRMRTEPAPPPRAEARAAPAPAPAPRVESRPAPAPAPAPAPHADRNRKD